MKGTKLVVSRRGSAVVDKSQTLLSEYGVTGFGEYSIIDLKQMRIGGNYGRKY